LIYLRAFGPQSFDITGLIFAVPGRGTLRSIAIR
jgi:hypothetical protein